MDSKSFRRSVIVLSCKKHFRDSWRKYFKQAKMGIKLAVL